MRRLLLVALAGVVLVIQVTSHAMPPSSDYEERLIEGFRVMFSPIVKNQPDLYQKTLAQVTVDLANISKVVPENSIAYLRNTVIWFEQGMPLPQLNFLFFNGSKALTKKYGLVPESYGGVIAGSTEEYLATSEIQAWQLLHELTHAFHQFDLRHNYEPVKAAYRNAIAQKVYLTSTDSRMPIKVYALKNHKEYFSELTVAYFARHRKFPHNRSQLAEVDPNGYCAIVKAWGLLGNQVGKPPLLCQ